MRFNPRTREGGDTSKNSKGVYVPFQSAHPIQDAMATHSKIRPFRALTLPLIPQNRRVLGNPFPLTHPCVCPLREKTSRFYDHLRFALELFFGSSHRHLCRGCKFSVATAKRPSFWPISSPNQATDSTLLDNQRPHQTFPLVYQKRFNYKQFITS